MADTTEKEELQPGPITTSSEEDFENFDKLLNVVPSKLWLILVGFVWLTISGFLWLFFGSIPLQLEGKGLVVENSCVLPGGKSSVDEQGLKTKCSYIVDGYISLEKADTIKVGQKARVEFFSTKPGIPAIFNAEIKNINPFPVSLSSLTKQTGDPSLAEFLLEKSMIATEVSLQVLTEQEDQQSLLSVFQKGIVCRVYLIIENIQPVSLLIR